MSKVASPSRWLTVTVAPARPGGTEYWLPRNATSACALTTLLTIRVAGNAGGNGPSSCASAAARAPTAAWLVQGGNRKVRYRGIAKNDQWLHHRLAALNLRRMLALGLHQQPSGWAIA